MFAGTELMFKAKAPYPRTENCTKILKVENFQNFNIFPRENLCRPITFYKIFFLPKIFPSGNQPKH